MITDAKKWHYLAVTNLSAFLAKNHQIMMEIYVINWRNSKKYEEICNNHDSCPIEMPKWVEKILKYNPGEK